MKVKTILIVCLFCLFNTGCGSEPPENKVVPKDTSPSVLKNNHLVVGVNTTLKSASIILAHELGFFKEDGLDVELLVTQSGVATKKAFDNSQIDIATVPEIIAANDSLKNDNWQIISSINRSVTNELVARKDSGIHEIADLRGKKIGLKKKSGAVYWLHRMLIYNSLSQNDVELVDGKPANLAKMLREGEVDAVVTWYPHAYNAINALGDNVYHTSAQLDQEMYWLLIARKQWLIDNPELAVRFMKVLIRSNLFIKSNTSQSKEILAKFLKIDKANIDFEWPLHKFKNELPQNLLMAMEEEVQFKIDQQGQGNVPDFLDFFYFNALEEIDPMRISIVH